MPQIIWTGQSGCLLPILIIFNLLFGKLIFNSTSLWLGVEAALVLLFIIKIRVLMRKINRKPRGGGRGRVIDVEGKVVEESEKLK